MIRFAGDTHGSLAHLSGLGWGISRRWAVLSRRRCRRSWRDTSGLFPGTTTANGLTGAAGCLKARWGTHATFLRGLFPSTGTARGRPRWRAQGAGVVSVGHHGRLRVFHRKEHLGRTGRTSGFSEKVAPAIWPEDYEALACQQADILVTHEAPSCHPFGFVAIDHLARTMGVELIVHGHHHRHCTASLLDGRIRVIGVGLREAVDESGRPAAS